VRGAFVRTLCVLIAGCSLWRPLPGANLSHAGSERLGHAKVFMRDGTELDLSEGNDPTGQHRWLRRQHA
jgi:hypothetical protein